MQRACEEQILQAYYTVLCTGGKSRVQSPLLLFWDDPQSHHVVGPLPDKLSQAVMAQ